MYPQSEQEFLEMTNKLEQEWYINDDYDNFYSEWCKIMTVWKEYYITFDR